MNHQLFLHSHQEIIQKKAVIQGIISRGGILLLPTETVYGVGGSSHRLHMAEKISSIKQRDPLQPISYHVGSIRHILDCLKRPLSPTEKILIQHFLPGPLTLLLKDRLGCIIGIRYPLHPMYQLVVSSLPFPLFMSSANLHHEKSPIEFSQISCSILREVNVAVVDPRPTDYQQDSTIIDLSSKELKLIRQGTISLEQVQSILKKLEYKG